MVEFKKWDKSFHDWIQKSMIEIVKCGYMNYECIICEKSFL